MTPKVCVCVWGGGGGGRAICAFVEKQIPVKAIAFALKSFLELFLYRLMVSESFSSTLNCISFTHPSTGSFERV